MIRALFAIVRIELAAHAEAIKATWKSTPDIYSR